MTTAIQKPEVGDEVSFSGGVRGRNKGMQTGVVVGFHYKEFRGRRRELNEAFGGATGREVLKVQTATTIWMISPSLVTVTKKKAADPVVARTEGERRHQEIKSNNKRAQAEALASSLNKASESGLLGLRQGDRVEVSLHDRYGRSSWYPCTYLGVVRSSGRIRISQERSFGEPRIFSTPPQFVRVPVAK